MSFKDYKPDSEITGLIISISIVILIVILTIQVGKNYDHVPDRSVIVPAGEVRK